MNEHFINGNELGVAESEPDKEKLAEIFETHRSDLIAIGIYQLSKVNFRSGGKSRLKMLDTYAEAAKDAIQNVYIEFHNNTETSSKLMGLGLEDQRNYLATAVIRDLIRQYRTVGANYAQTDATAPFRSAQLPIGIEDDEAFSYGMESAYEQEEFMRALYKELDTLEPKERQVLILRWGLGGEEWHTLEETDSAMGTNRGRARQIENRAMRKLRHPTRTDSLKPHLARLDLRSPKQKK